MREEFIAKAKELNTGIYVPTPEYDIALINWWRYLNQTGDFDDLFTESQRPFTKFAKIFDPPCILVLTFEDTFTWNAIWFTPFGDSASSAFVGNWCDSAKRGTKEQVKVNKFIYDFAFAFWQTLVGITKHERLLRVHRKLGYNIVGSLPHFLEGEEAWIVYLTKENFQKSKFYSVGEKV
jgi:hypothetical protein